jgi:hypothetical protein
MGNVGIRRAAIRWYSDGGYSRPPSLCRLTGLTLPQLFQTSSQSLLEDQEMSFRSVEIPMSIARACSIQSRVKDVDQASGKVIQGIRAVWRRSIYLV